MSLPAVGKYQAKLFERATVVDREQQDPPRVGVEVWLPCEVDEENSEKGKRITAMLTLVSKERVVQVNNWNKLREIFGPYDDPCAMFAEGENHFEKRFEMEIEDHTYDGETRRRVKWVDPIGGGGGLKPKKPSDPKAIVSKYGSMFRALAGGSAPKTASKAPSGPPKPPGAPAPECTLEDAWNALKEHRPGADDNTLGNAFNAKRVELFGQKDPLSPAECGRLRAALIEDNNLPK